MRYFLLSLFLLWQVQFPGGGKVYPTQGDDGVVGNSKNIQPFFLLHPPAAYWSLDETSGTRADSLGTYDLTDSGSTGYVSDGINGNAAHFSTSTKLTNASFLNVGGASAFSESCWIRHALDASTKGFIGDNTLTNPAYRSYLNAAGSSYFMLVGTFGTANSYYVGDAGFMDGNWHHWCAFWGSGGKVYVYRDGTVEISETASTYTGTLLQRNVGVEIGFGYGTSYSWYATGGGDVDECAIWTENIGAEGCAALWNDGAGEFY